MMDPLVFEEVENFHRKGNFVFHGSVDDISYLHDLSDSSLGKLTGNELSVTQGLSDFSEFRPCEYLKEEHPLFREESTDSFSDKGVSFDAVTKLVSPLMCKGESFKRGYPSGGALYPIETFICSLSEKNNWPNGKRILHLLPRSGEFELLHEVDSLGMVSALAPKNHDLGSPSFAVVYVSYLPKTLFKYRYRGYRLALMETGSMYMLLTLQAQYLGLGSRVWSAYTDDKVCKMLRLNPSLSHPFAVQFFGY